MNKLLHICIIVLIITLVSLASSCDGSGSGANYSPEVRALLERLDSTLNQTEVYVNKKEVRLKNLRATFNSTIDIERKYWLASDLYEEYCAYDADSAMNYVDKAISYAHEMNRLDLVREMELNKSYLYTAVGLLGDAEKVLRNFDIDSLPPTLALIYCDRMVYLINHRDQYMGITTDKARYTNMIDSLLQVTSKHITPDAPNYCWLLGWSHMKTKEEAKSIIPTVEKIVSADDPSSRGCAMDSWMLAQLYEKVDDSENALKYLIRSSIADVMACNKEIASLEEVALNMLNRGDLEHANSYINYCIALANDYKSRVRLGKLASIQDQTLTAIHERMSRQAKVNRICMAVLVVMILLLLYGSLYIMRQNKLLLKTRSTLNDANGELAKRVDELQQTRQELNNANDKLTEMYADVCKNAKELSEINEAKESYMANIFEICSSYITKHEDFRTNLHRLIKERKFDEALQIVRSPELSYGEIKELYANFDSIFLSIYPDFVSDFNKLLRPEEQITLKNPDSLTTALRIYALVRLGLNDSVKIAKFLHCSVQTVYNTRQRTRNSAIVPREEFADAVKALGKPSF